MSVEINLYMEISISLFWGGGFCESARGHHVYRWCVCRWQLSIHMRVLTRLCVLCICSLYTHMPMCVHLGIRGLNSPVPLSSTRLLCPWNSPGKNTGVGCHSLLPSRLSSWPRDPTWVSFITGRFFTIWATREAPVISLAFVFWKMKEKSKTAWFAQIYVK